MGAAYRKAINLKPAFAEAYQGLGMALLGQQKPAAAEAAFRKVLDRKPALGLEGYYVGLTFPGNKSRHATVVTGESA